MQWGLQLMQRLRLAQRQLQSAPTQYMGAWVHTTTIQLRTLQHASHVDGLSPNYYSGGQVVRCC